MINEKELGQELIQSLSERSWFISDTLLNQDLTQGLFEQYLTILNKFKFKKAQVGRAEEREVHNEIRKSHVLWINDWNFSKELCLYHDFLTHLMSQLNFQFFLSMKRLESQYAHYDNGGFYKKHLDQLKNTKHRQVTSILYLNELNDSGELIIYNKDDKNKVDATIYPRPGRFVTFFSGHIWHEVRPSNAERYSITSWMRDDEITPFI